MFVLRFSAPQHHCLYSCYDVSPIATAHLITSFKFLLWCLPYNYISLSHIFKPVHYLAVSTFITERLSLTFPFIITVTSLGFHLSIAGLLLLLIVLFSVSYSFVDYHGDLFYCFFLVHSLQHPYSSFLSMATHHDTSSRCF